MQKILLKKTKFEFKFGKYRKENWKPPTQTPATVQFAIGNTKIQSRKCKKRILNGQRKRKIQILEIQKRKLALSSLKLEIQKITKKEKQNRKTKKNTKKQNKN